MLNIYNIPYLKDYCLEKKEAISIVNLKDRLNELIKRKFASFNCIKELIKLYPDISKKDIVNIVFSMYNSDYLLKNDIQLIISRGELERSNLEFKHKSYFNYENNIVADINLNEILKNITYKYLNDFNIYRFLTLGSSKDFPAKEYIEYYIKKFLLSALILEFTEQGSSIHNLNIVFTNSFTKSSEKQLDNKLNKLPIIPFLEQYVSDNGSLNYNKKNIFGNISKDILQAFFSANLDVNPYNYTYLNIIKATSENSSTNDKRSSYTYEKFLEFLNSFKELIEGNKLNKLQEDLLELITNANFILTNSQLSPMNNLINYILKKDYLNCEKSSKNCIKFYYNCSLIPMPEYRILLSNAFHFSFINEQTIASFKKECLGQIELNEQNSLVNYASDTTVNAFNGYVEYLATKVIPNMIIEFFKNIQQSYRPLDNKGNINDNLMKLNKDIDNSWQSIFRTIQDVKIKEQSIPISKSKNVQLIKLDDKPSINSINTFYSIPKDKSINLKNIYCINPDDKPFIIKDGKLIVNYATKVNEKINKKEVINFNNINKDSFVNLHKLIFSAIYYDDEKLIISNDEIKHVAAKIEIDRLQDKEKLEKNVNKWYHQNRDSIIKKFNSLKGTEK